MATWNINSVHSEVGFKIKHLMVTNAKGKFTTYSGTLTASDDMLSDAKLSFEADLTSVHTGNTQRDAHLQSPDFFDTAAHPKLTFVSKSFTKKEGNDFLIVGDLTLRGVTKEVALDATFNGISKNHDNVRVAGFDVTTKINRTDYGIGAGMGEAALSDTVTLDAAIQLKEQA